MLGGGRTGAEAMGRSRRAAPPRPTSQDFPLAKKRDETSHRRRRGWHRPWIGKLTTRCPKMSEDVRFWPKIETFSRTRALTA